ncbi:MAG: hypothetical protein LRY53_08595 [Burkholderiaceae bacterium]|nr:hypothetical protein [Burkholderiaceae bacterium]MCD8516968.1 hypothetical protein [Burkholderiaceae bacterium]MCD8536801.1 hypothetical protein [Burkholderiaceae bacterium]MCD8565677.1 hypothetical protein [Burkholderiaceae bacterium]
MRQPIAQRTPILAALLVLTGCSTTYIPPEPQTAPDSYVQQRAVQTSQTVQANLNDVWRNITAYSQERYRTVKQNKSAGQMTLFVDAFEPSSAITCGMIERRGGSFDTHTEFLSALTRQTPVNLNITVDVKLTAKSATQTLVSVNADYNLATGYQTNPGTGAIVGGSRYRFDSKGHAMVNMPGREFAAKCQPTGSVETGILDAAAGN